MKKRIVIFLCLLMTLTIGIPAIKNTTNSLNAAEGDTYEGEKIIDFDLFERVSDKLGGGQDAYFITADHNVLHKSNIDSGILASNVGEWQIEADVLFDTAGIPLNHVIAISGSSSGGNTPNGIALRDDNKLYVWGYNSAGQFGNGTTSTGYSRNAIMVDPGIPNIKSVLSTVMANYIVTESGDVYASGDNTNGALGNGTTTSSSTFTKVNIENVEKLTGNYTGASLFALKKDGTVFSWGCFATDGHEVFQKVTTPIQLYAEENQTDLLTNIVDIDNRNDVFSVGGNSSSSGKPIITMLQYDGSNMTVYTCGPHYGPNGVGNAYGAVKHGTVAVPKKPTSINYYAYIGPNGSSVILANDKQYNFEWTIDEIFSDFSVTNLNDFYKTFYNFFDSVPLTPPYTIKKLIPVCGVRLGLLEDGRTTINGGILKIQLPLKLIGQKLADNSIYGTGERYNNDVRINTIVPSGQAATCKVQDPLGSTETECTDFINSQVDITLGNDRIYRKYIFTNSTRNITEEFIVDLYKGTPKLNGYNSSVTNKIKTTDTVSWTVPSNQSSWNSYSATITDALGKTTDFASGSTMQVGSYTLVLKDAYGNSQEYKFEVTDKPTPTAVFTPNSTNLVYRDAYTVVNGTIGTLALQYPAGEETSNIASISVSGADSSKFSIDNSGALKVKGSNLNAGTYNITISGTDGNNMPFNKDVSIVVGKANQDNYQITNDANYSFRANQEIAITTSGNESGGSETFTIISGTAAQISSGNKFKILNSGNFTLQATVAGNTNYNDKTVTKTITISELPMQSPAISINSSDSMMYGDTYRPTSSGGQGSGAVSWSIESDNGTGAVLSGGTIKVTGVGSFTLKVTKAGDSNVQSSSDSKVITVNRRKTTVKPKTVTKLAGEVFKPNGVAYNPSLLAGDSVGTPNITSKYPNDQAAGMYSDGIQVSGLSNPNYEFVYEDGTLIINSNALPNNGSGYYKVIGTKGKNNWYVSDVKISTTGKDGYDLISEDGISFQSQPLTYTNDGDQNVTFYLKNSTTGIIAKGINISFKIDQTAPSVPTLTMQEINTSTFATFINTLSFGNWMKQGAEVTMLSSDDTSGIDHYEYSETSKSGTVSKTSLSGIVTYQKDVELTIKAKACDKAGNCSEESSGDALMIDRKAPTINGVKDQAVYKYYYLPRFVTVSDDGSGLAYAEYTKDGVMAGTLQDNVSERIDGVGEYTIQATDNAGNEDTLTFEIVPLPDIDDIDGSDESKEIIDQVQEEYNEIKNKIDDTEKTDIKDWIKDALDKWNDSRKKVVETDDKSAKVEGEGDTNFDPRTELIVDEISENDIPKLPKKPLVVYDVYLRKGTTRIQPDGSIKVYLPLVEASAPDGEAMGGARIGGEPIVYQIDTNNKVTQLSVQKEGSFVTFITDHLVKYAISDETQEDNENNNCVVSGDGILNTGDDVCGLPNDKGDQPEKQPDGSVNVPDGGKVEFPNGIEIDTPDGAIIHPDGSVTLPDGTEYDPDGNIKDKDKDPDKDKDKCPLEGKDINVDTDGDGKPDLNVDLDGDCVADLNIDTNFDNVPDVDIDTDGDGKPDINVDTDHDGKADLNIAIIKRWIPKKDCVVNGFAYDTSDGFTPYLNVDDDGDGKPDRNIDDNGDGIPDRNIDEDWFDKYGDTVNGYQPNTNVGGASTGDDTKWTIWWILLILTSATMAYSQYRKRTQS